MLVSVGFAAGLLYFVSEDPKLDFCDRYESEETETEDDCEEF